jgi:hypothetical protein
LENYIQSHCKVNFEDDDGALELSEFYNFGKVHKFSQVPSWGRCVVNILGNRLLRICNRVGWRGVHFGALPSATAILRAKILSWCCLIIIYVMCDNNLYYVIIIYIMYYYCLMAMSIILNIFWGTNILLHIFYGTQFIHMI